jgi:beta-lactamase superfamily II metal-dependent hydrolase
MGKLRVIIFNVEHGFCAFVKSPNNYGLLIDCGERENFSPIKYIIDNEMDDITEHNGHKLAQFILTHPHDDHLSDVERLKDDLSPAIMTRQRYDWESIKQGENQEEYENLDAFSEWQESYNQNVEDWPDWGMELKYLENNTYLSPNEAKNLDEKKFVNNSSIVVAIKYKGWKIVFPGDLEKSAWLKLLGNQNFKDLIKDTSFFIASHHGHSSGYCKEIFENMGKPHFNIVSAHKRDESVDSAYSSSDNARGVKHNDETRYMLSTRKDGTIVIEVDENGKATFDVLKLDDNIKKESFYRYY